MEVKFTRCLPPPLIATLEEKEKGTSEPKSHTSYLQTNSVPMAPQTNN